MGSEEDVGSTIEEEDGFIGEEDGLVSKEHGVPSGNEEDDWQLDKEAATRMGLEFDSDEVDHCLEYTPEGYSDDDTVRIYHTVRDFYVSRSKKFLGGCLDIGAQRTCIGIPL